MTAYVALLRAINVGGTGKLSMSDLTAIGEKAGFAKVRTYIASGNVVFESALSEAGVKATLEQALSAHAGRPMRVLVRTAAEMKAVAAGNPFAKAARNRTVAIFLDRPAPADAAKEASGGDDEEIVLGRREIYVHYPSGQGRSKLKIPAARDGTARNLNTVARLAEMAAD